MTVMGTNVAITLALVCAVGQCRADFVIASGATFSTMSSSVVFTPANAMLSLQDVVAESSAAVYEAADVVAYNLTTHHVTVYPATTPSALLLGQVDYGARNIKSPLSHIDTVADIYMWDAAGDVFQTSGTDVSFTAAELDVNGAIIYVSSNGSLQPDADGDAINDYDDNCIYASNRDQFDANSDGFGNRCDADLNNDLFVNTADYLIFRSRYLSADSEADFNHDGFVNTVDYLIFRGLYLAAPGPTGRDYSREY